MQSRRFLGGQIVQHDASLNALRIEFIHRKLHARGELLHGVLGGYLIVCMKCALNTANERKGRCGWCQGETKGASRGV